MKFTLRYFLLISFLLGAKGVLAEHLVVLVAGSQSPIQNINFLELRKIYLGISIRRQGKVVHGLRNISDNQLNQIFLQSILAMSKRSYRRRLLSTALKYGTPRPTVFKDQETLLEAVSNDPYAITYMWQDDVQGLENLKTLKILWRQ